MSLFNKEDAEAKKKEKLDQAMAKYGIEFLSDEADRISAQEIVNELFGMKAMEVTSALAGKPEFTTIIRLQKAIIEQNFIMIRQLDRLNNK